MNNILKSKINIERLLKIYESKGYKFYEGFLNLNIFGVRSINREAGKFDDVIGFFWVQPDSTYQVKFYAATTDAGVYYLKNPMNTAGTLIMNFGQYISAYEIGYHNGKYLALRQVGLIDFFRDNNKDKILDLTGKLYSANNTNANIHRASEWNVAVDIGKYSAGCQVIRDINDWNDFFRTILKSSDIYGDRFSYTLLSETDFDTIDADYKAKSLAKAAEYLSKHIKLR